MAKTLEEWINTDVKKLKRKGVGEISTLYFFRDPTRSNIIDNEKFYSPADGVILYQKVVENPNDPIVEIKGKNYTIREVLDDPDFNKPCLIIGIFMTFYDVHINRIPYGGLLKYKQIDAIQSYNMSMLATEKDILKKTINPDNLEWLQNNERMLNTIHSPALNYTYYVVQIADSDVDCITPFNLDQNEYCEQNSRFSQIRYGSMCEMVLPLDSRYDFEILQQDHTHIECCIDPLIHINRKCEGKYF